jgi:release factor glutamine methyltransferase
MRSTPAAAVLDVRGALKQGIEHLENARVPSAALAAEILLIHALRCDRTFLYRHPEEPLGPDVAELFSALIARRAAGEPAQYLTGKQEFWGLEFEVAPGVLIPRPETEHLIEVALERIGALRRDAALRIADVGTGSGSIAVALAKELPNAQIVAADISPDALAFAQRNATRLGFANRIQFVESDLLAAIHGPIEGLMINVPFDLIVSNPPYVAGDEAATLPREVRDHEPHVALFGGPTGIEIYSRLIEQASVALVADGTLVIELGYDSAERVRALIDQAGVWTNVSVTNDLAGIPRVLATTRDGAG